jgi:spectinomycin phosphotransferase
VWESPVNLSNETLCASLRDQYALAVTNLTFLPIGHDASAWVYRVETAGGLLLFLKVRRRVSNPPSLLVPSYLQDHGIARVIAPLPSVKQSLWTEVGGYALIVYPFVAGVPGKEHGLSTQQWIDYGATFRQIHNSPVAPALARVMRRETYIPSGAATVRRLAEHVGRAIFAHPEEQTLATFWRERQNLIITLVKRAEDLGRLLAQRGLAFVLCHADAHTANVLLDTSGQVWIVDWDETLLAPKERDLMFVVRGISSTLVGPREQDLFFQGYGTTALDALALAYYRYAWAVSEIGEYGEQVFFRPDLGQLSRRAGVDAFKSLFLPGSIVMIACERALGEP